MTDKCASTESHRNPVVEKLYCRLYLTSSWTILVAPLSFAVIGGLLYLYISTIPSACSVNVLEVQSVSVVAVQFLYSNVLLPSTTETKPKYCTVIYCTVLCCTVLYCKWVPALTQPGLVALFQSLLYVQDPILETCTVLYALYVLRNRFLIF